MSGHTVRRGWRALHGQLRRLVARRRVAPVMARRTGDVADWLWPYRIPDGDIVTGTGWEAP